MASLGSIGPSLENQVLFCKTRRHPNFFLQFLQFLKFFLQFFTIFTIFTIVYKFLQFFTLFTLFTIFTILHFLQFLRFLPIFSNFLQFFPGMYRRLSDTRSVRLEDDGSCVECGAHGAEGRGVRQPRQDLHHEDERTGRRGRSNLSGRIFRFKKNYFF